MVDWGRDVDPSISRVDLPMKDGVQITAQDAWMTWQQNMKRFRTLKDAVDWIVETQ